jgi:hypothetical protein
MARPASLHRRRPSGSIVGGRFAGAGAFRTQSRRVPTIAVLYHFNMSRTWWTASPVLAVALAASAVPAGCGSSSGGASFAPTGHDGGSTDDATAYSDGPESDVLGFGDGAANTSGLDVEPATLQTITVTAGQATPTVTFHATNNGMPAAVGWGVDRGNIGTIAAGPATSGVFTPSGTTGGLVDVVATLGSKSVQRQVLVKLTATQNGANSGSAAEQGQIANSTGQLSQGGGIGGVGGEGLGGPVSDPATLGALQSPTGDAGAQSLALLYPYDKTVWPRGMLAPLLMWRWAANDADAVKIDLATTSGSFTWSGTFARPTVLGTSPFVRHPIPQDVWDMATETAGGPMPAGTPPDKLTVSVTIAKGGTGYGPISETWVVAPARLTGTVYYNSYGTQLVKNWTATDKAGHPVGAAILGVRSGDLAPKLVVGVNSPLNSSGVPTDDTGCRVCHVVSSRGKWLLTQSEQGTPGDGQSYLYDLTQPNPQASAVKMSTQGVFAWAAMMSDGSYALTNAIDPSSSNPALINSSAGSATSSFWQFGSSPVQGTLTGLKSGVAAGYPSYSPDDKYVAYVDVTGSTNNVKGPLVKAAYDATGHTFSNPATIYSPQSGQRVGYPVFLPDDSGILFETEVRSSTTDTVMVTRDGARSELWWIDTGAAPKAVALATLNGKGYLPLGPNNHGAGTASDPRDSYSESGQDDTTLDYEPTVLPVAEGGYAWVVFTSRRMYGNMLQAVPYQSWPPDYDTTNLTTATTKKLWVAAIDLNAPSGTDPSHPAFYLPAQEILAGNSRGFWVLDPCKADGQSCQSGDQCCNGYCEPDGDGGALICSNTPPSCAGVSDKCKTAADCCDSTNTCVNGFCAQGSQ